MSAARRSSPRRCWPSCRASATPSSPARAASPRASYASLNVGRGSGDDPARVAENRRRAAAALGRTAPSVCSPPTRSTRRRAVVVDAPLGDGAPRGRRASSPATPGLVCGALAADCAPVLIADAEARVVAAVHAGWRGALAGVVEAAVDGDGRRWAPSRPACVAAVGPCIGPASYEVGLEFLDALRRRRRRPTRGSSPPGARPDKRLFDLPAFVLVAPGAPPASARAEWIGRDTCAEEDAFFSNRRAVHRGERDYGRLLSAIMPRSLSLTNDQLRIARIEIVGSTPADGPAGLAASSAPYRRVALVGRGEDAVGVVRGFAVRHQRRADPAPPLRLGDDQQVDEREAEEVAGDDARSRPRRSPSTAAQLRPRPSRSPMCASAGRIDAASRGSTPPPARVDGRAAPTRLHLEGARVIAAAASPQPAALAPASRAARSRRGAGRSEGVDR